MSPVCEENEGSKFRVIDSQIVRRFAEKCAKVGNERREK